MAYFDSSQVFSASSASPVHAPEDFQFAPDAGSQLAPEPAASFQHTEWAVIAMARHDDLATLTTPRTSRIGRLMFGRPRSYSLTSEPLEALRRLAVEAWHQPHKISLPSLGAFISVGYSSAQLALLLSTTGALPIMAKLIAASLKIAAPNATLRNST